MFRRPIAPPKLTEAIRDQLVAPLPDDPQRRTLYDLVKCAHCGGVHDIACPRVRRMRFRPVPGGTTALVEVEFWPEGQWSREGIIWPSDVYVSGREYPEPEQPPVAEITSSTP